MPSIINKLIIQKIVAILYELKEKSDKLINTAFYIRGRYDFTYSEDILHKEETVFHNENSDLLHFHRILYMYSS